MSAVFHILTSVVHICICLIMFFFCTILIYADWNERAGFQRAPGMITGFCLLEMFMIKSPAALKVIRVCYDFLRDPFGRNREKVGPLLKVANGGEILFWVLLVILIAAVVIFIKMNRKCLWKALRVFPFLVLEGCLLSMMLLSGRILDIVFLLIYVFFALMAG